MQPHERTHVTNYSKAEEVELIAKIVRDLRDVQIGDSCYVLPPSLLALEKQVIGYTTEGDDKNVSLRTGSNSILISVATVTRSFNPQTRPLL